MTDIPLGKLQKDVAKVFLVLLEIGPLWRDGGGGVDRPAGAPPLESLRADEALVVADGEAHLVVVLGLRPPFGVRRPLSFENEVDLQSCPSGTLGFDPEISFDRNPSPSV